MMSGKAIVPNKSDAVFGRGRKQDSVRKGSLYRYLIEEHWAPYSQIEALGTRRDYVQREIVDKILKKKGRFIVREGQKGMFLLNPRAPDDLRLIYKKVQRALFNEKKRQQQQGVEVPEVKVIMTGGCHDHFLEASKAATSSEDDEDDEDAKYNSRAGPKARRVSDEEIKPSRGYSRSKSGASAVVVPSASVPTIEDEIKRDTKDLVKTEDLEGILLGGGGGDDDFFLLEDLHTDTTILPDLENSMDMMVPTSMSSHMVSPTDHEKFSLTS